MPSLRVTGACHVEGTPSVGTGPRRGGRSPWSVRGSEQRFWTGQRGPMGPTGGRGPAAGTGHGGRWPHTRRRRSMVGTGRAKAAAGTGLKRTEARARTWRQAMEQRTGHAPRTGAARDRGGLAPEHAGTETEQKTEPHHDSKRTDKGPAKNHVPHCHLCNVKIRSSVAQSRPKSGRGRPAPAPSSRARGP